MKTTGRYSEFEVIETDPSKPFLNDLAKDLKKIDEYYLKKTSTEIKKKMIELILESIN
jgi:hypothetical protein